jgi:hypothetical protein
MIAELVSFYPGCQTTYRWQRALERNAWAPDWIIWGKPKSVFMFFSCPSFTQFYHLEGIENNTRKREFIIEFTTVLTETLTILTRHPARQGYSQLACQQCRY